MTDSRVSDWARFGAMLADLPLKRARFVKNFIVHGNATKAAGDAGYSLSGARVEGTRLLAIAAVQEAITLATELRDRGNALDRTFVVDRLMELAARCSADVPILNKEGVVVGQGILNPTAALKALELLGKTLGIFREVQEHTGPGGKAIVIAPVPMDEDRMLEVARILQSINALPAPSVTVEAVPALKGYPDTPKEVDGPVYELSEAVEPTWDWDKEDGEASNT